MYIIIYLVTTVISIFVAITAFEFSKAAISTALKDPTPKSNGWLTLNPFKFFEPIGFLLFLFYGYGWGYPAETSNLYYKNRKRDILLTYGMPIVICIVLGKVLAVVSGFIGSDSDFPLNIAYMFLQSVGSSLVHIGVFNIIPLSPMAGSRILRVFLSPNAALKYTQNEKLFQMVFMFVWFFGYIPSILDKICGAILWT